MKVIDLHSFQRGKYKWPNIGSVLLLVIFGLAIGNARALDNKITDREITLAVETELLLDPSVPSHLLDVRTNNGIVTLAGRVDNLLAKERTLAITETIKGVRSVVNTISVRPVARTDDEIQADVKQALENDPATDPDDIGVRVDGAVVTLTGEVASWAEMQLAEAVTKGVKGVREIENDISVKFQTNRSDREIKADILRRLENDAWVFDRFIDAEVRQGRVILHGSVGSAAAKTRANSLAWVSGVTSVDDSALKVQWQTSNDARRENKIASRSDEEIKQAVKDAFLFDPRVRSFNPEIVVNEGEVILSGTVGDLSAKKAAEEAAKNTTGVWRVLNFLKVRPISDITDEDIALSLKDSFSHDPIIERHDIEVDVYNGKVYLSGAVDSEFEKTHAQDIASRVRGVIVIENDLTVDKSWTWKSDRAIAKDVKSELFWNPRIDSEVIQVVVDDGVVTLNGTVHNGRRRQLATREAYDGGARSVRNHLTVAE